MNFKHLILSIFFVVSIKGFCQVNVQIQSLNYTNSGQPTVNAADCGEIDLESSSSTSINLGIALSKPSSLVTGSSKIYVYSKKSASATRK